jgi:hypothetical protein
MPCKYANVEQVCQHCYSRNFMDTFKQFFHDHAYVFQDAPLQIRTEQSLQYYELFQKYLRLFEVLSPCVDYVMCSIMRYSLISNERIAHVPDSY